MLLKELIQGLDLTCAAGPADIDLTDLTDDSRRVVPGCAFVARGGAVGDGRRYISDALARGAAAIITDIAPAGDERTVAGTMPAWVIGANVDQRLAGRLAERCFGEPAKKLRLIAITGTNGKTTTAYLVQRLLHEGGLVCGVIGTVIIDDGKTREPSELTTPGAIELSRMLARMVANGCAAAVIETSSHALAQGRTGALSFDAAVFTNLTGDHLDYHHTMEDYAAAKAILFNSLSREAWAIVNADDAFAQRMVADCVSKVLWCTVRADGATSTPPESKSICRATVLSLTAEASLARFDGPWGSYELRFPLVGRHNVSNALQAIAAVNTVRAVNRRMLHSLEQMPPVPGRLEVVRADEPAAPSVIVDYAHTHDALENVLLALRPVTKGRLIVLFGCGGDRDRTKRPKMAAVACKLADRVIVTSDNPRTEDPHEIIRQIMAGVSADQLGKVTCEPDREAAIRAAVLQAHTGDTVLLAGKGHEDYQIIGTVKRHFDDREVAASVLRQWRNHAIDAGRSMI